MLATVGAHSMLMLPAGTAETTAALPSDGLRHRLEELARRSYSGRIDLQADNWRAELLMRQGELIATALVGPGLERALTGAEALTVLLEQAVGWTCGLQPLDADLLEALAGLGARPEARTLESTDDLRRFMRELVENRQSGTFELNESREWARVLLAKGRILGAYSVSDPELVASLAPLSGLLRRPAPELRWHPASGVVVLPLPALPPTTDAGVAEVERRVTWVLSRFEGAWGRARERGGTVQRLFSALVQMLGPLVALANCLEATRGDPAALTMALEQLPIEVSSEREAADFDPSLRQATPEQACPVLVGLVVEALERIVRACPDPSLAECSRQAASALEAELRSVVPRRGY